MDGELILRYFGEPPDVEVRRVDPDFLYSIGDGDDGLMSRHQGLWFDSDDHDRELYFEIHRSPVFGANVGSDDGDKVPAAEVVYRSRRLFNERPASPRPTRRSL